jgi:ATP-dependent protease ClpP protease subunit
MPDWKEILDEIGRTGSTHDVIRRQYLERLSDLTGRNTIIYYSGWLQKPDLAAPLTSITDADKSGFMTAVHNLDPSKGLDLVLHTPGGETAATESIVDYLRQKFGTDIRAVVPQLAMSGGTMVACACRSILMGRQSSLGPIDPQLGGLPAHGIMEEFEQARREIAQNPASIPLWQPIIAHYRPTLIGECQKSIAWADEMVSEWLRSGMFSGEADAEDRARVVLEGLGDHALTKSHARHLSAQKCIRLGMKVEMMEDSQDLQDAVLSVHHACIHTLSTTSAAKIIENHLGVAFIQQAKTVLAIA